MAKPKKTAKKRTLKSPPTVTKSAGDRPAYSLRRSRVHGRGVFAARAIEQGERIIEYVGERISHEEADRRHEDKDFDDNHTFLFTVDAKTVIDAGVGGNEARYVNHSCDPNCKVVSNRGRLFIKARRPIAKDEELAYDYKLNRSSDDPPDIEQIFGCRCGSPRCRGTMLTRKRPKPRVKAKATSRAKVSAAKKKPRA